MEYFLFLLSDSLSGLISLDGISSIVSEFLGPGDIVLSDMLFSDLISYSLYFVIFGFITFLILRLFVSCFRKMCEVFLG